MAEGAYYAYANAHGGVFHRSIKDITLDDAYDPSQMVPQTKKLVEQDHVFAIVGSLGTAPILSTWKYLNQKEVPQVLVATGDAYWGQCSTARRSIRLRVHEAEAVDGGLAARLSG